MANTGEYYEALVGSVQRALDEKADVAVGQWIDGPDGRRDMDVRVLGTRDGLPHLVLIECKDRRDPVGVEVIDAFDSKRHDFNADTAIVFSNSGFTSVAARKAERLGIQLASALHHGDANIRLHLYRKHTARRHVVRRWLVAIYAPPTVVITEEFQPNDILIQDLPLLNWISQESTELMRAHPEAARFHAEFEFGTPQPATIRGKPYLLIGFAFEFICERGWVEQTVREDVTLGSYDLIRRRLIIPSNEGWIVGPFDRDGWTPCEPPIEHDMTSESGTIQFSLELFAPIEPAAGLGIPAIGDLISGRAVTTPDRLPALGDAA